MPLVSLINAFREIGFCFTMLNRIQRGKVTTFISDELVHVEFQNMR